MEAVCKNTAAGQPPFPTQTEPQKLSVKNCMSEKVGGWFEGAVRYGGIGQRLTSKVLRVSQLVPGKSGTGTTGEALLFRGM